MRTFAVWYKDLARWDVKSFTAARWYWPREVIHPLACVLRRKVVPVDRKSHRFEDLKLITIHFDGPMEPRDLGGRKEFKGRLFFADAGDVVYSKIDVRNGAIGVVPDNLGRIAVSSEYPVYFVDSTRLLAPYVQLLFRTSFFREKINGMVSGTSGRKRVKPDELETIEIPVPPLEVQRGIIEHHRRAQEEARNARKKANHLEQEISRYVLNRLGVSTGEVQRTRGPFLVWFKDLERWSAEYHIRAMHSMATGHRGKFPVRRLGDLVDAKSGGTPSKKRAEYWNGTIPWVSPKDMKADEILDAEDHITKAAVSESSLQLVPENSVLVVVRSGILQRTFPVAINRVPVTINQDMKALIPHRHLLPEYLAASLRAIEGKVLKLVKHSTTVQSINSPDLMDLEIPLPPPPVQEEIVARVKELRDKITALREGARQIEERASREVEEMILGVRPV